MGTELILLSVGTLLVAAAAWWLLKNRRSNVAEVEKEEEEESEAEFGFSSPSSDNSDNKETAWSYPVYFGTNRKPSSLPVEFGNERNTETTYGVCHVTIPRSHKFGSIGSSWFQRLVTMTDDRLVVQSTDILEWEPFAAAMNQELASDPEDEQHLLVYIHGYNQSFTEAAIRAAQIGFDLKIPGATAFFSWPSDADVPGYMPDEATIEGSEAAITDFLIRVTTQLNTRKVHIIAHSMGNRGLLRSLQRIRADVERTQNIQFGQIFLAAPDMDVDLFRSLAEIYPQLSERTTLYVSPADRALKVSGMLHQATRVGYAPPVVVVEGIDTLLVPGHDLLDLGHGYYAEFAGVLNDMYDLIRWNQEPGERQRLVKATDGNETYWKII